MKQKIQKVEEVDVGEEIVLQQVKINQLVDNNELQPQFFDVAIVNDSSSGDLKIILKGKSGRDHMIAIQDGRINLMRMVKSTDSSVLNKQSDTEWLKSDGTWGPEPVKTKRANAPFTFHIRDIQAQ